jgi:nitrite reductase/ring-hydroxylating ferredoxin subunit
MKLIKICNIKCLKENKPEMFVLNEKKYLVIKKNSYYIMDAVCLHKGGPLNKGRLLQYEIECPWHGCRWSIETGESCHNNMKLKTYSYVIKDNFLYVIND